MLMSISVLIFLFVGSKLFPRAPMPLIAILLAAGVVKVFDLGSEGLALVGSVPSGLPTPRLPGIDWSDVQALLLPAVGVTVVAYTDNALTGRAFRDPQQVSDRRQPGAARARRRQRRRRRDAADSRSAAPAAAR